MAETVFFRTWSLSRGYDAEPVGDLLARATVTVNGVVQTIPGALADKIGQGTFASVLDAALATVDAQKCDRAANLADLTDKAAARAALGLGEVATMTTSDIIAAVRAALDGREF